MNRLDRLLGRLPWLMAMLIVGAIVHIVSVLALPSLAPRDAFARLEALTPLNTFAPLPPTRPGAELLPFEDSAIASGVCRYDLAAGPLRLRAQVVADRLLAFTFYSRQGQIFYAMTDRAALRGAIDVRVVTAAQLEALEARDPDDEPPQELRLTSATPVGFIMVRAFAAQPGDLPDARARAASVSCASEGKPQNASR